MTIIKKQRQRSKPKYYIYFNEWTGKILSVGQTQRDIIEPYIYIYSDAATDIINGNASLSEYKVVTEPGKEDIVLRNDDSGYVTHSHIITPIDTTPIKNWDIRFKLYTKNNMLLIEFGKTLIAKLLKFRIQRSRQLTNDAINFNFYLTKKDNPDFLAETIVIDIDTLINEKIICYDIGSINKYFPLNELQLLTHRYFDGYYFEKIDEEYNIEETESKEEIDPGTWKQVQTNNDGSHIELIQNGNQIEIHNNISMNDFSNLKITNHEISLFVVGDSPDDYKDMIKIDLSEIYMGRNKIIKVDYDLDEVNILYRHATLDVTKRKMNGTYTNH